MATRLISNAGYFRDSDDPQLRRELGARIEPDYDLLGYVVRNFGYIALRRVGASLHIRLRPAITSVAAWAKLFRMLGDEQPDRVLVTLVDPAGGHRLVGNWARATRHLVALADNARPTPRCSDHAYLRRTRPLNTLGGNSSLARLLGQWGERSGRIELGDLPLLLDDKLRRRYVVIEASQPDGRFSLRSVGHGFVTYKRDWHAESDSISGHPDYDYAKWVSAIYGEAFARREPMLDDVDVLLRRPGQERLRMRYRRMLLPIHGQDGKLRLLGASELDPGIDLRGEA